MAHPCWVGEMLACATRTGEGLFGNARMGCLWLAYLVGCISRQLVLSAWEPAGELEVRLLSMMERETLLEGWLQQNSCLAHGKLEPNASAFLPLPLLQATLTCSSS